MLIKHKFFPRAVLRSSLAVMTLVFALLFVFTPPEMHSSSIYWRNLPSDSMGALRLTREVPEVLSITLKRIPPNESSQPLLDLGGLRIEETDQGLTVITRRQLQDEWSDVFLINSESSAAKQTLQFNFVKHQVCSMVSNESRCRQIDRLPTPVITKVETTDSTTHRVDELVIETLPTGVKKQGLRALWGCVAILLLALFSIIRNGGKIFPYLKKFQKFRPQFSRLDGAVFVSLLLIALLSPTYYDDGWVLQRVDSYTQKGVFGNYYDNGDAWLPQGFWIEQLFSIIRQLGGELVHLRLVVVVAVFFAWLLLKRTLETISETSSKTAQNIMAAVLLMFSISWLMTIRAEPFVVLSLSAAYYSSVLFLIQRKMLWFQSSLILFAFCISLHQTGLVAIGALSIVLFALYEEKKGNQSFHKHEFIHANLTAITVSLLLLFPNFDVRTLLFNYDLFQQHTAYGNPLNELVRYQALLTQTPGLRVFSIGFLFIVMFASAMRFESLTKNQVILYISTLVTVFGLIGTSSKWPWHFGVYAVPACLLSGLLFVSDKKIIRKGRFELSILVICLFLLLASTLSITNPFNTPDLVYSNWGEFANTFGSNNHSLVWGLLLLSIIVLGVFNCLRIDPWIYRSILTSITFLILTSPVLTLFWLATDARRSDGWSMPKQLLAGLTRPSEECGSLSGSSFILDADELEGAPALPSQRRLLQKNAVPSLDGFSGGPFGYQDVYGTWFNKKSLQSEVVPGSYYGQDITTGRFYSERKKINGTTKVVVWSVAGSSANMSARILFYDAAMALISSKPITNSTTKLWALNEFDVPQSAVYVVSEVTDDSKEYGGWFGLTSVLRPTYATANALLKSQSAFAGPVELIRAPCLKPPINSQGVNEKVSYLISDTGHWNWADLPLLTITQIGCADSFPYSCLLHLDYKAADYSFLE